MLDAIWLVPAFPLAGFLLLLVFGPRLGEPRAGWLATAAMAGSFISSVVVFIGLVDRDPEERRFVQTLFEWVPAGDFSVDVGFLVDPLSVTMILFVTGVGTLIHLYSVGYMHGDEKFSKFFLYLNLFAFSMLMLVLGDNLLLTFLGWEGVGACSYFLISFWFADEANASAGKKAFVTNRIGDFGFMMAMFLAFGAVGSIDYVTLNGAAPGLAESTATAITLMLFLGAAGKSAQLPLFVWLPDAMAGPTPVSALIHAATMVTSGVYLLTRMNPVLDVASSWGPSTIAWVGAATALFAATIAVAQNDIKKVLAYSTVSQLGYMVLAVGVGAYVAAIFHMVTHAFFKALLFLGSGSVIHGMDDDQDMRHYGGLYRFMPITATTFIVGWLAIAGVPPFSGFWSKDEILLSAWDSDITGAKVLWLIGLITALLTAFYMSRQVFLTFFGRHRYADVRPDEVAAAWESRVESSRRAVEVATAAAAEAATAATAAESAIAGLETAVADRAAALADADDEGREAAAEAHAAAVSALDEGRAAAVVAADRAEDTATAAADAERTAEQVAVAASRQEGYRPATLFEPSDVGDLTDDLPEPATTRAHHHPHESPWTMTVPLVVLAGLAIVAGVLNLPFTDWLKHLDHWLEPTLAHPHEIGASSSTKWGLAVVAVVAGAAGIAAAVAVYLKGKVDPERIEKKILADGWNYDSSIARFMGGPGRRGFDLVAWFDRTFVDGAVNGVGRLVRLVGGNGSRLQSGLVRAYAAGVGLGAVLLVGWFLTRATF